MTLNLALDLQDQIQGQIRGYRTSFRNEVSRCKQMVSSDGLCLSGKLTQPGLRSLKISTQTPTQNPHLNFGPIFCTPSFDFEFDIEVQMPG